MPPPDDTPNHLDTAEFRDLCARVADIVARYHDTIEDRPVGPTADPGALLDQLPTSAPEQPEPWDQILADVESHIIPALTHWQSPRFFAYFPANASFPAVLADLLCSGLAVQGMLWQTSPACTELETRTLDWMGDAIALPEPFLARSDTGGGVIQGTASEAALCAMVAARHRATTNGADPATLTAYTSQQAHSSIAKAARIIGLPHDRLRLVPTDNHLRMDADALQQQLHADTDAGLSPFFCCATLGTTSTGANDPLHLVAPAADRAGAWVHVDAAWAGSALLCPEHRDMTRGIEHAHSFNFNPHKWLLVNFDCSLLWTTQRNTLVDALSITPEYLRNRASDSGAVIDYRDWQVPLGRRFRALKLWFVMRHYGLEGLRAHIRQSIRMTEQLENHLRQDDRFVIDHPRALALLCFRLAAGDDATQALMHRLNASGRLFLSHTTAPDHAGQPRYTIRFAVGATHTTPRHIDEAWDAISTAAAQILQTA